jgi:NADP-reducing hydrogenase subunit HndB
MKSLEALKKLKERALKQGSVGIKDVRARVVVAMGTCSIAAGASETMAAIKNEMEKQHVSDVVVTQSGCMGLCEFEPLVQVQVKGEKTVTYGKINPECVPTLFEKHILGGEIVTEWLAR